MKLKRILYSTTLAAVLFASGCKKDKFDINANPDDVTDVSVTPSVLLPGAQQRTSEIVATNWTFLQEWLGYWARSGSYQSNSEIDAYQLTSSSAIVQPAWNNLFSNARNYHLMQQKAAASGQGFYDAVGRIMRSHNFQILVDVYNNVPYFEAFRGTASPTPKFDKGIDIYNDIFKQLDTAIALLGDPTSDGPSNPDKATADLVYEGDNTSWIRFANTLRLRMLVHLHNGMTTPGQVVSGVNIAEQVGKITSAGFIGAGQSAHLNPGFSASKPQPFYRVYHTNESGTGSRSDDVRANEYAITYYEDRHDPRIDQFYELPASGHHLGIPFGLPSGDEDFEGSDLSTVRAPGYFPDGAASRAWIMTSVESLFLQAEARERGILTTGPSAKELLTTAVRESFVWLGLTAAEADGYLTGNADSEDVDYDASVATTGNGLYAILSQKWFALNGIATYEVWTDYRRTNIVYGEVAGFDAGPTLSVDPGSTATRVPIRMLYPQAEYSYNAANVGAEGNINIFTSKIFWDLN
jgi:hypothetical protein